MAKAKVDRMLVKALPDDPEVKREYRRLQKIFESAPEQKLELAGKLISRAAFLSVQCDRLERDIVENGYGETYQNGANQMGKKKSAAAELHVSYTKNLSSILKQLHDMLGGSDGGGDLFDGY